MSLEEITQFARPQRNTKHKTTSRVHPVAIPGPTPAKVLTEHKEIPRFPRPHESERYQTPHPTC